MKESHRTRDLYINNYVFMVVEWAEKAIKKKSMGGPSVLDFMP